MLCERDEEEEGGGGAGDVDRFFELPKMDEKTDFFLESTGGEGGDVGGTESMDFFPLLGTGGVSNIR